MTIKMITDQELRHIVMALERSLEELQIQEQEGEYIDTGAYELISEALEISISLLEGEPVNVTSSENTSVGC